MIITISLDIKKYWIICDKLWTKKSLWKNIFGQQKKLCGQKKSVDKIVEKEQCYSVLYC